MGIPFLFRSDSSPHTISFISLEAAGDPEGLQGMVLQLNKF